MATVIWADGRLRTASEPVVSAIDHGLTVGDGVFETMAVRDGVPFALSRHLRRLRASATGMGLPEPDEAAVLRGVDEVLAVGGAGRLRITITAGPGPLGSGRIDSHQTVLVVAGSAVRPGLAKVITVPWVRNERSAVAGVKTTSYAENVVALAAAHAAGAQEALLANTVGELCEGTGSNVVVERDGELLTPPLSSGCLAGVTRELLLEWAAEEGMAVREAEAGELPYTVLGAVARGEGHLALTSSLRGLVPVIEIDGHPVQPGPATLAAADMFDRRAVTNPDP